MDSIKFIKVATKDLRIGMYVVELDRPWLETPFLVQGFIVKSVEELEALSDLCAYVVVDTGRSRPFHKPSRDLKPTDKALTKERLEKMLNVRVTKYKDSSTFKDELVTVNRVFKDYDTMVTRFYSNVKESKAVNLEEIREPVNNVVDSIIRNPDACMLLTKLKRKGDYSYNHALGSSIWAAAMARQLGLPKKMMSSISMGALLLDVGKVHIPDQVLNKIAPLTPEEVAQTQRHVELGLKMLQKTRGIDKIAFQMVMCHHERHNGKGYPKGLKDKAIPIYGRIAGIVDTYDALVNDKPYRLGLPPSEAIRVLYNVRDVDFQGELVEQFIQALGVYPSGSIVELSNGEVGIVVTEHRNRRLRPKLLMLLDNNKERLQEQRYLDLYEESQDENGKVLEIVKSLTPGDYGLVPEEILV